MIKLRRLMEVDPSGNFSVNCDTSEQFQSVQRFFNTNKDKLDFKELCEERPEPTNLEPSSFPKFTIHYNNLHELLKLREIFRIRASKFDMYLIEKRGYNPFNEKFAEIYYAPIVKVRK